MDKLARSKTDQQNQADLADVTQSEHLLDDWKADYQKAISIKGTDPAKASTMANANALQKINMMLASDDTSPSLKQQLKQQ